MARLSTQERAEIKSAGSVFWPENSPLFRLFDDLDDAEAEIERLRAALGAIKETCVYCGGTGIVLVDQGDSEECRAQFCATARRALEGRDG